MLCPACQKPQQSTAKFCQDCGRPLSSNKLASTDHFEQAITLSQARPAWVMSNDDRIPPHIRRKMEQAQEGLIGKKRFVTILFADVQGFTKLCESRDAEQVTDLMNKVLGRLGEVVFESEGYVDKFIGDCVMALFGAPIAHENDQELAVRCALKMLQVMDEINKQFNESLSLRIGINAGMVVAGGIGNNLKLQFTVMGDAVNLAQRFQSIAEPGQIIVGKAVYQATQVLFDYEIMSAQQVKGKSEAVEAFLVRSANIKGSDSKDLTRSRGLRETQLQLFGRKDLLAQLRPHFKSLQGDHAKSFLLVGEAGVGKSRLKLELKSALQPQGIRWLEATCSPLQNHSFLSPLKDLIRNIYTDLKALPDSQISSFEENLFQKLTDSSPNQRILSTMASSSAANLDFHEQKRQIFVVIKRAIEAIARTRLVVIFVDDLHFADESSLELFSYLAKGAHRYLICGAKRQSEGSLPEGEIEIVEVPPLSAEASLELAKAYLDNQTNLPPQLISWIHQRCQGNPYFIEESLRSFIEENRLEKVDGQWTLSSSFKADQLPSSLQALVTAKIDTLPPADREVLEIAAVMGRRFSFQALQRALPGRKNIETSLQYLRKLEFVFESNVTSRDIEYIFNQSLTRDSIYQSILKKRLKHLHQIVGDAYAADPNAKDEILAHHYLLSEYKIPQGLESLLRALKVQSPTRALKTLRDLRSNDQISLPQAQKEIIRIRESELLADLKNWDELGMLWAPEFLEANPSNETKAWSLYWSGFSKLEQGNLEVALKDFHGSQALAGQKIPKLTLRILRAIGRAKQTQKDYPEAEKAYDLALNILNQLQGEDYQEDASQLLSDLATVFVARGDLEAADSTLERAEKLLANHADPLLEARISFQRGLLASQSPSNPPTKALQRFHRCHQLALGAGQLKLSIQALLQTTQIYSKQKAWKEAERCLKEARQLAKNTENMDLIFQVSLYELATKLQREGADEITGSEQWRKLGEVPPSLQGLKQRLEKDWRRSLK